MKKISLCCTALFISVLLCAEKHQLGDYVEKDGVPSIVVYVDQTGEHGLLLSMKARGINEKDLLKEEKIIAKGKKETLSIYQKRMKFYHAARAKKQGAEALAAVDARFERQKEMIEKFYAQKPIVYTKQYYKIADGEREKILQSIQGQMNESGQENTRLLLDLCAENNLSVRDYFPIYDWVSNLGNDWFIPGNDELELMAQSLNIDNLGEAYKSSIPHGKNDTEIYNIFDSINSNVAYLVRNVSLGLDYYWFNVWGGDQYWPLCSIQSSTMVKSNWSEMVGNKSKTKRQVQVSTSAGIVGVIVSAAVSASVDNLFYSFGRNYTATDYYWTFFTNISGYVCAMSKF